MGCVNHDIVSALLRLDAFPCKLQQQSTQPLLRTTVGEYL